MEYPSFQKTDQIVQKKIILLHSQKRNLIKHERATATGINYFTRLQS